MNGPEIRGWCPGALRPMLSGDGFVVRVRPRLGELSGEELDGLATLSENYGNGDAEVTGRANIQLRGVKDGALEALREGLEALGLLDMDAEAEARRNVVLCPFRDGAWDQRAMAAALVDGLRSDEFAGLTGKFGFVVDAGPRRWLAGTSGDVRIESDGADLIVRADGAEGGAPVADETSAAAAALDLARWFIDSGGIGPDGRGRMKAHLARTALPARYAGNSEPADAMPRPEPGLRHGGGLVAAAFGRFSAGDLRVIAADAPCAIRVTPFRMLFLPGLVSLGALASRPGLITRPGDPLLRVVACTGAPGCSQASVETRALARRLAARMGDGVRLHVSGCAKGCAHPAPAEVTLVGKEGTFGLVRNGAPWDEPDRAGLTPGEVEKVIGR